MSLAEPMIRLRSDGHGWLFPARLIAENRAHFYAERDKDTTYDAEYEFTMGDPYELRDWFMNNMDWEDVEKEAHLIETPPNVTRPNYDTNDFEFDVI